MHISHQAYTEIKVNENGFLEINQQDDLGGDNSIVLISYNNRLEFLELVKKAVEEWE
jgi:hypothetical protein